MVSERAIPKAEALLEGSPDGFAAVDPAGLLLYLNPAGRRMLGASARAPGEMFLDFVHSGDRDSVRAVFRSALASESGSFPIDFRPGFRNLDGGACFARIAPSSPQPRLEARVSRSQGGDGKPWLALGLREAGDGAAPDRGGRVTAELPARAAREPDGPSREEDLRAKSRLLDMLLASLPVMTCRLDADGTYLESRGEALRAAGLADDEAVGRNAMDLWPNCRHLLERALRGESVHFEYEMGQGERKRVLEIWFTPDPAQGGAVGFGVDITDRKRAEEELSTSEAFGRRVIESSRDCIMVLGPEGMLLSISNNGRRLMEIDDPEAYLSRSWMDFWRGEDRGNAENALRSAVRTGMGKFQGYCPSVTGKPKWWDVIITPILSPSWEPERLLAVCRDITEHKRFEESLRRSKEQLEAILRAISDSVVVADSGGRVVFANDAAARLLGRDSGQAILDDTLEELAARLSARDESGAPVDWPFIPAAAAATETGAGKVLRVADRKGSGERWLVASSAAIRDCEGRIHLHIASAYDFTERKMAEDALHRSEEHLRQSQKMEAVGRLAGGVAHDFNNLLTAINGYSEMLTRSLRESDPLQATVGEIRRAGERAASLTRQLLTFSRRQAPANRLLDINSVVGEIRHMLSRLIGEDIQLVTVGDPALARINMDPGQLEQVILNLALNARDAMPRGGRLTIESANSRLEKGQAGTFFSVEPGRYVRMTVADTGSGMSEEVMAHLFEPFFTTKPPGQGTGLGLSTVYGIVKTAGGNLSVTSQQGAGTTFAVYFPMAEQPKDAKEEAPAKQAKPQPSASGKETILLVEDEDMVRRLIGQVLLSHGYNVLEAGSGMAALEVVDRYPGTIHLLLTDVVMAGMSGRELSERLVVLRPGLKVLYMSGYTDDAILRHGVYQNSAAFLGKPFSPGTLVRKLREVIDGGETSARQVPAASIP